MNKAPSGLLVGAAPHLRNGPNSRFRSWLLALCLFMPVLQSAWFDQAHSLLVALAALAGSLLGELPGAASKRKARLLDGSALVQGLLLTLMLPASIPLYIPFFGALASALMAKFLFGGTGSSWIPVSLFALLLVRFTWPLAFEGGESPGFLYRLETFHAEFPGKSPVHPLDILKMTGFKPSALDAQVTRFINRHILRGLSAELPFGYIDLLFCRDPSALIADRGGFALLLVSPIAIAGRLSRFRTGLAFLLPYLLMVFLFEPRIYGYTGPSVLTHSGPGGGGDILFSLLSGGCLLSAVFILQDTALGGFNLGGSVFLALCGALLAFLFRQVLHIPHGILYALSVLPLLSPSVRLVEWMILRRRRETSGRFAG